MCFLVSLISPEVSLTLSSFLIVPSSNCPGGGFGGPGVGFDGPGGGFFSTGSSSGLPLLLPVLKPPPGPLKPPPGQLETRTIRNESTVGFPQFFLGFS